jgi:hypothetical protein
LQREYERNIFLLVARQTRDVFLCFFVFFLQFFFGFSLLFSKRLFRQSATSILRQQKIGKNRKKQKTKKKKKTAAVGFL